MTSIVVIIGSWIGFESASVFLIRSSPPIAIADVVDGFDSLFCEIESDSSLCGLRDIAMRLAHPLDNHQKPHRNHKNHDQKLNKCETSLFFHLLAKTKITSSIQRSAQFASIFGENADLLLNVASDSLDLEHLLLKITKNLTMDFDQLTLQARDEIARFLEQNVDGTVLIR